VRTRGGETDFAHRGKNGQRTGSTSSLVGVAVTFWVTIPRWMFRSVGDQQVVSSVERSTWIDRVTITSLSHHSHNDGHWYSHGLIPSSSSPPKVKENL
jgi:hypothetical protein